MKFLKVLLYILLGLGVVYLILCIAGPKKMEVSESMNMHASPAAVFEEISDFSKWPGWSPWHQMDAKMTSEITGEPAQIGHKQSWVSDVVGKGSQTFVEIRPNEYIKSEMHFNAEDSDPAFAWFDIAAAGDSTKVTWTMDGETPFLFRGISLVFGMNKMIAEQYRQGLTALKKIAEAKPAEEAVSYEIVDMPDQWYVGKRFPGIKESELDSALFGNTYGELGKVIGGMDKLAGAPFSVSHSYDEATHVMDLEIAVPVAAEMKVPAGFNCVMIPGGKVAKYVHKGPYDTTPIGWGKFMTAATKDHKPRWAPYEVYANDPMTVKSPDEIESWLMLPIE